MRTALLALFLVPALATPSAAKVERTAEHSYARVWSATIRHIRIDEGHSIVDKDQENGYVVFEVKDDGKVFRGALELIRIEQKGKPARVRLVLSIEDRPTYMESGLLERLLQKLHLENRDRPEPPVDDAEK